LLLNQQASIKPDQSRRIQIKIANYLINSIEYIAFLIRLLRLF
jgi:hypothetical protein